jgi:hypothetical protein
MKNTDLYLKPGTYIKSSTTSGDVQGLSLENFVVGVLNNPTCCPKPPGLPDGMLMTALPLNLTLQTVTDFLGNSSAIQLSTLRLGIRSDSSVTTQTSSVIQATTTNANLVIAPNGTGALIASIPDGTATGGNARGANAVDLQILRGNANQVAAGDYSVALGTNNRTVSPYTVAIGTGNTASGFFGIAIGNGSSTGDSGAIAIGTSNTSGAEYGVVSGGQSNIGNGRWSVIGGGLSNNQGSQYGTISGGQTNTASTGTHATVVGGQSNTSSGETSLSGGLLNTASGGQSTAFGRSNVVSGNNGSFAAGQSNTVSGNFCAAFGASNTVSGERNFAAGVSNAVSGTLGNAAFGNANTVSSDLSSFAVGRQNQCFGYGFASGYRSVSIGYASRVLSNNAFATLASSQIREMIASREAVLTSAATTTLSLDGTGVTNLISTLYDVNRMWNVTLKYVAVVTTITGTATGVTIGDIKTQTIEIGVKRVVTVSSIVGAGNYSTPQQDASMTSASLIPSIVGNDLILTFTAPTFSGGGSVTCRVVAKVELTEVAYA